jgi:LmbE family N-acetylglucosaminyl deacetylase
MRLEKGDLATTAYAHVYFSPHLDDAVFACGGNIARQQQNGERVLVVTAFSGESDQRRKPDDKALAPFVDMDNRRREDEKAMNKLGVDHLWLGYNEAIQRHRRYSSLIGMTSRVLDSDSKLCEALLSDVVKICHRTKGAQYYFPLAVGHHVDHQILFEVGATIEDKERLNSQIQYYEDVAYTFIPGLLRLRMKAIGATTQSDLSPDLRARWILREIMRTYQGILSLRIIRVNITPIQRILLFLYVLHIVLLDAHLRARRRERRGGRSIHPQTIDITEHLQAKLDAAVEYRSQVAALVGDVETFRQDIERYSASIVGKRGCYVERYWRVNESERET